MNSRGLDKHYNGLTFRGTLDYLFFMATLLRIVE